MTTLTPSRERIWNCLVSVLAGRGLRYVQPVHAKNLRGRDGLALRAVQLLPLQLPAAAAAAAVTITDFGGAAVIATITATMDGNSIWLFYLVVDIFRGGFEGVLDLADTALQAFLETNKKKLIPACNQLFEVFFAFESHRKREIVDGLLNVIEPLRNKTKIVSWLHMFLCTKKITNILNKSISLRFQLR